MINESVLVEYITFPVTKTSQNLHPRPSSPNIPPHSNLIPSPHKLKPNQRPSWTWKLRRLIRRGNPLRRTGLGQAHSPNILAPVPGIHRVKDISSSRPGRDIAIPQVENELARAAFEIRCDLEGDERAGLVRGVMVFHYEQLVLRVFDCGAVADEPAVCAVWPDDGGILAGGEGEGEGACGC